jgi:hypothetical protein
MRFSEIDIVENKDLLGNTTYAVRGIKEKVFINKAVARAFIRLANEYETHMLSKWDEVIQQIEGQIQGKRKDTRQ